jgi:predicted RNA polymerase sigma factor
MAQRISRAKRTIRTSDIRLGLPIDDVDLAHSMRSVLRVLYLIFNEGYTSSSGSALHRVELSGEAIRLARMLHRARPGDAETAGLLALMLLTDARRPARTTGDGALVPLAEQNRSRWNQSQITEGLNVIADALAIGAIGEYQLQAAIAAVHDQARRVEDTDWTRILALYGLLANITSNPLVTVNQAIATAMVHGPAAGLALLDTVDAPLHGHYRLDAVRAHLAELAGDTVAARTLYRTAAAGTTSLPEKHYLTLKAARLRSVSSVAPSLGE